MKGHYDIIVVGGGSAGAVMAGRLSEDERKQVLLVEGGECYLPNEYPDILALAKHAGGDAATTWPPSKQIESDVASGEIRAKVLGGGSAINAAGFVRAPKSDFDRWTAGGLTEWTYQKVLPYYKKAESADFGEDPLHGRSGPVPVHLPEKSELTKSAQAFIEAALNAGIGYVPDLHVPFPKGIGIYPLNVRDGIRINTGMAYLPEAVRQRPNLHLLGNTMVDKVLIEKGRCRGIQLLTGESIMGEQVVLSAGTMGTAAILLRSGIGPKQQLQECGIPMVADLPVGSSIMDQPDIYVQVNINGDGETVPPIGGNVCGQSSVAEADELDFYLGFNQFANPALSPSGKAFGVIVCACRASSRGELRLDPDDISASPRVSLNLLADEREMTRLVDGLAMLKGILDQEPLKNQIISIMFKDGSAVPDDRTELEALIRRNVDPCLHMTSTAPMGSISDLRAVVDEQGRVHGLSGLRVADASIFPDVPSVATNATVIMMAEYLADRMKAEG